MAPSHPVPQLFRLFLGLVGLLLLPTILGVDSLSILFNHRSVLKQIAVLPGFLKVFKKEGSLERMGKVPLNHASGQSLGSRGNFHFHSESRDPDLSRKPPNTLGKW